MVVVLALTAQLLVCYKNSSSHLTPFIPLLLQLIHEYVYSVIYQINLYMPMQTTVHLYVHLQNMSKVCWAMSENLLEKDEAAGL